MSHWAKITRNTITIGLGLACFAGAPVPALAGAGDLPNANHWSFPPLQGVAPPESGEANPIDAFVFAKLHEHGLEANPPAAREVLIRRLTSYHHGIQRRLTDFHGRVIRDILA